MFALCLMARRLHTLIHVSGLVLDSADFSCDALSTHLCIPPDSQCSGMTVFTNTYACLRTRSGLSGLAPKSELPWGANFHMHLWIPPDSSGFSGLAPEAGIVTLSQFLHALIDVYGLVPFGVLKF